MIRLRTKRIASAIRQLPYSGAGVLFVVIGDQGPEVLLAQRRRSGIWSIPGGGMEARDRHSFRACAKRETLEEFGSPPQDARMVLDRLSLKQAVIYPWLAYNWVTYIAILPAKPVGFPSPNAPDYHEFRTHAWFPIDDLPQKRHWLLAPALRKTVCTATG